MLTVSLKSARFNAPVGLYVEELQIWNEIEVDIDVSVVADISHFPLINYEELYQIARLAVQRPVQLLESVVQSIVAEIELLHPSAQVEVCVRKLHPPLGGQVQHSAVRFVKEF